LTARDSIVDGSDAVRHRLVVREDGKPPTHFVSGLIHSVSLAFLMSLLALTKYSNSATVSAVVSLDPSIVP